jgi:hypothetical protein
MKCQILLSQCHTEGIFFVIEFLSLDFSGNAETEIESSIYSSFDL